MHRSIDPENYPVTLDRKAISALPVYMLPTGYTLGSPGMGCFNDAPGYPTYYMQPVYYWGNTLKNVPDAVIMGPDGHLRRLDRVYPSIKGENGEADWFASSHTSNTAWAGAIRRLYKPLPLEHARVQAWIAQVGAHLKNCYTDAERPEYKKPGLLIFPVPAYKLRTFRDDPRWNDAYRAALRAEVEAFNAQEIEHGIRTATVDNHRGVQAIREMYPDWSPPDGWMAGKVGDRHGDWWETDDAPPAPGACPGMRAKHGATWNNHDEAMSKGGWCQFCGETRAD